MAVDGDSLVTVQAKRSGPKWALRRSARARLAGGAVMNPHNGAFDTEAFGSAVKNALKESGIRGGEVSLSIPDIMAKTAILEFDERPSNVRETEKVVKWKAARSMYADPEELSMDYSVLSKEPSALSKGPNARVLVVGVKKGFITGPEDSLRALGLRVVRLTIHSFNLLRLITGRVGHIVKTGDFALVLHTGAYFSVSVFRGGVLDFYRCKPLGESPGRFQTELGSSFAYYRGKNPGVRLERIYLFSAASGYEDLAREVSGAEVAHVRPEHLLTTSGGGGDITLLSALGAAAGR